MIFQDLNISGYGQAYLKVNLDFFWHCQATQKKKTKKKKKVSHIDEISNVTTWSNHL